MAALTAHAQESMLEPPALQIRLDLLLDIPWQRLSPDCPLITKVRIVLGDEPIASIDAMTSADNLPTFVMHRCAW